MIRGSNNIRIIRVFIGSPGGLKDERQAARDVVTEVNLGNSKHWGCMFELLGWEDTIPGFQRPQSKINEDLDKCDYFIGVIWNHWGSRPSNDPSGFTSGFEEEFSRAADHIAGGRMKDLALYFKAVEIPQGLKPGDSLQKVINFREKCIEEKKVLFKDFTTLDDFRNLVRAKLVDIGWAETGLLGSDVQIDQSERAPALGDNAMSEANSAQDQLIDEAAVKFISELCKHPSNWDATAPHEVARFRLISSAVFNLGMISDAPSSSGRSRTPNL